MLMHQALNAVNGYYFLVLFYVLSNIEINEMFAIFWKFQLKILKINDARTILYERCGSCASCLIAGNITQATFADTG